jgi:sugar lactone lactonase YvrE
MRQYKLKKCKRVHGLHFTPDGARLFAVGGEEVRMVDCAVWLDLSTGENADRIDLFAQCYAVDPGQTRYVLGGANKWFGNRGKDTSPIQWRELPAGDVWRVFPSPARGAVTGLAFDASGTRLAFATEREMRHGDVRTWEFRLRVARFDTPDNPAVLPLSDIAQVIAFNADATRIAVTGGMDADTRAVVYDLSAQRELFRFDPPGTVSRCVRFLPDNRLVVANGKYVYVLPPEGGEPLFTLAGHPKQVNAVALTPDGQRLLTASHDGSIRTWDASTGDPGPAFDWGIGAVTAVAFAPDGLTCAAAGLNGKVVVWDVEV